MSKFTNEVADVIVGTYSAAVEEGQTYEQLRGVMKALAATHGFTIGQIQGKLVAEGVYKRKEAVKADKHVAASTKEDYRKAFEAVTGKTMKSMENMTKKELVALWEWHVDVFATAEAEARNS